MNPELGRNKQPADYWMYGLKIRSDFQLPGWTEASGDGPPDVRFRRRHVPSSRPGGRPYTAHWEIGSEGFTLAIRGVAVYRAFATGNHVDVDTEPGATPQDVLLYLTGVLLGIILHFRRCYPLHAGCVAWGPNADGIAVAGPSGAGKSTLLASLLDRGGILVTDDVTVLERDGNAFRARPGARRLRLDAPSLEALERPPGDVLGLESGGGNRGKYQVPVEGTPPSSTVIKRVYVLQDDQGPVRTEPLFGMEAVSALVDQTYVLAYASSLGMGKQCFTLAAEVAGHVPVARLIRPPGFQHLPAVVDLIIAESGA